MHRYRMYFMPMNGSDGIQYTLKMSIVLKKLCLFNEITSLKLKIIPNKYWCIVCHFGIQFSEMTVIWHTIHDYLLLRLLSTTIPFNLSDTQY